MFYTIDSNISLNCHMMNCHMKDNYRRFVSKNLPIWRLLYTKTLAIN